MAADDDSNTSVTLDASKKTLTIAGKRTAEIIAVLSLVVMAWLGWVTYTHSMETKASFDRLGEAMERLVQTNTQGTCLLGFPEAQREAKARWCEDLARTGRR